MKGTTKMRVPYKSFCAFVILLFAASSLALAQGIAAGSGEAAGTIGYARVDGVTSYNHFAFGGSGSYNLDQNVAVGFEYKYTPLGSETIMGATATGHLQTYGGVARISFCDSSSVVPFALVGFGGVNQKAVASAGAISVSASQSGYYFAFGSGASILVNPRWGIRPEFRYERQQFVANTQFAAFGQNDPQFLVSVFYQFSGLLSHKN
jgi:opacity protein-like surface antigen